MKAVVAISAAEARLSEDCEVGRSSSVNAKLIARLNKARKSFACRRIDFSATDRLLRKGTPQAGDLLLARVETIGHHAKLESPAGRRATLYPGDEIIVAFGARYAPDQFEADVPPDLSPCELVASGGIAARVLSRHSKTRRATRIKPIGLLADVRGKPLNLADFALPRPVPRGNRPIVVAIAGTSMNSGKTTSAAALVHGLARAGLRVAGIKVSGTGSGNDLWSMADAGAEWVFDFTDLGYATTAGLPIPSLEQVATDLVDHVTGLGADIVVLEVADGLFQAETSGLLQSATFQRLVTGVLFAASNSMGAVGGADWLARHNLSLLALTGLVTASPLAMREVAANIDSSVLTPDDLMDPHIATNLCFSVGGGTNARTA